MGGRGCREPTLESCQKKIVEGPRSSGNGKKRMNVRGDTEI